MTAKDKANELVEKFYQNSPEIFGTARAMVFGTKMALIVVDEIINLDDFSIEGREFWNNVKIELEALS